MNYSSYNALVADLRDLSGWTDKRFRACVRAELKRGALARERHIAYLLAKWNTFRREELQHWVATQRELS